MTAINSFRLGLSLLKIDTPVEYITLSADFTVTVNGTLPTSKHQLLLSLPHWSHAAGRYTFCVSGT